MASERIAWIDWMKVLGISLIVYGHFFTVGYHYVYVFVVPLFFMLSGFLFKREANFVFFSKLWNNLVCPMLIICVLNFVCGCVRALAEGTFELWWVPRFFLNVLIGEHGGFVGVGICWFVYTLVLLKLIAQYARGWLVNVFIMLLCLVVACLHNKFDAFHTIPVLRGTSSILNVAVAWPFFFIGMQFQRLRSHLCAVVSPWMLVAIGLFGCILVWVSGHFNSVVWMNLCGYGDHLMLFLLGGVAGTVFVWSLAKLLSLCSGSSCPSFVDTISRGTILILGFHLYLVEGVSNWVQQRTLMDGVFAVCIVLAFVPIIRLCERFFPLLLGQSRIKRNQRS